MFTALRSWRWRQPAGTNPIVLTRDRVYILPTGAGVLFAVALVLMLLGAINYNLALGHALVFLLAGLGPVGMVHVYRNLAGISITPGRAEPVFAGETAHFFLHLGQERQEARFGLEISARGNPYVRCELPAAGQISVALPVAARRRGWLALPVLNLASRYPLGFFRAWSTPRFAIECLVYPRPLMLPLPPASPAPISGTRHGDGGQEDFAGLRLRQPADSPRHIAWKAAARDGAEKPLLVKQFSGGAQNELWLDWRLLPDEMDTETRLSVLTGWVLAADAAGSRYGLSLPGVEIAPAEGTAHRQRCLENLALASP
ncbi:MAG: hypothetical protein H6R18_1151 [Proteobacteria bacterium]|nr:hypothetical protein [Pseudomonadota bacterium]